MALAEIVQIVAHPQIDPKPTPVDLALNFAEELRGDEGTFIVSSGPRRGDVFSRLCRASGAKGNLVRDAYCAALAIESGAEWITAERDDARFPVLRWRRALAGASPCPDQVTSTSSMLKKSP